MGLFPSAISNKYLCCTLNSSIIMLFRLVLYFGSSPRFTTSLPQCALRSHICIAPSPTQEISPAFTCLSGSFHGDASHSLKHVFTLFLYFAASLCCCLSPVCNLCFARRMPNAFLAVAFSLFFSFSCFSFSCSSCSVISRSCNGCSSSS